uniref:SseB family protein n=1 Tax=Actinotalea sp. C106 TaxID=2908644 RepID=UPI002027DC69
EPDGALRLPAVVRALAAARVLVPVMAELGVSGAGVAGLEVDKEASTGIVALQAPDGRTALPVFSGSAAMATWHPGARPVPAEGPRAAAAAIQEGWEILVVDPGGSSPVVVPRPAVRALALGLAWEPAVVDGQVRGDVGEALARAATSVPAVLTARAEPGRRAEVALVLGLAPGLDRPGLDAVLAQVNGALAAEETLGAQVDSLEMTVVPAG